MNQKIAVICMHSETLAKTWQVLQLYYIVQGLGLRLMSELMIYNFREHLDCRIAKPFGKAL